MWPSLKSDNASGQSRHKDRKLLTDTEPWAQLANRVDLSTTTGARHSSHDVAAVWKLHQVEGVGWVRELFDGAPIVTAVEGEGLEFSRADDAGAVLACLPAGVRWELVARPPRAGGADRGCHPFDAP